MVYLLVLGLSLSGAIEKSMHIETSGHNFLILILLWGGVWQVIDEVFAWLDFMRKEMMMMFQLEFLVKKKWGLPLTFLPLCKCETDFSLFVCEEFAFY